VVDFEAKSSKPRRRDKGFSGLCFALDGSGRLPETLRLLALLSGDLALAQRLRLLFQGRQPRLRGLRRHPPRCARAGLDLLFALIRCNFVAQPVALALDLGLALLERGAAFALLCLLRLSPGLELCLGLGLLQPALASELVIARRCSERILGLADDLADEAAGGPLAVLAHVSPFR
jgi:hypothetical protein